MRPDNVLFIERRRRGNPRRRWRRWSKTPEEEAKSRWVITLRLT